MDVGTGITISDSWLSRGFDGAVVVMAGILKMAHRRVVQQAEIIRTLQSQHELMRSDITNLADDIREIRDGGKEMQRDIKTLLARR